jgi:septal ring-binding cell division protein DamX
MGWAERGLGTLMVSLMIVAPALAADADPPAYGKVDTFQPGKKYSCVPSADRKSWNCAEAGKAGSADPAISIQSNQAPAENPPTAAGPPLAPTAPPVAAPSHSGNLPGYLSAAAASAPAPAQRTVPAAAPLNAIVPPPSSTPVPAPIAEPPVSTIPQSAPEPAPPPPPPPPAPVAAAIAKPVSAPEPAPPPVPKTPPARPTSAPAARHPKPAPVARAPTPKPVPVQRAPAPSAIAGHATSEFLQLPGDHFVIELAHAASASNLSALRSTLNLPSGEVYQLHLRQNGADTWLLVWGSFNDIASARAARNELPADIHAGWPRRIAPLQTEVRRVQE